jgi:2-keto-3-deoxy-L-rhamnonate aldolase RhmA
MVETPYALKKYLAATKLVFSPEEREEVCFLVNIETITGYNNLDAMLELPEIKDLGGIVLGRVDMTG